MGGKRKNVTFCIFKNIFVPTLITYRCAVLKIIAKKWKIIIIRRRRRIEKSLYINV